MTEEIITKRLHVAGLTPSITAQDLTARFSSFGSVLAVDGLGLLDGVGQPRRFAYVTLLATPTKLTRCMNLLSGTLYKGAKLRIGEARPDWEEQWSKEHEPEEALPRKKRRLAGTEGKEAGDLELVTVENVEGKPYWHLTALQHLIRPVRMRPLHPLPPPPDTPAPSSTKPAQASKRKLKVLEPPKRARRVVIDPPRWGAVHLTGELLEAGAVALPERVTVAEEVGAVVAEELGEKVKTKKRKGRETGEMEADVGHAEPAPGPTVSPAKRAKPPPAVDPATEDPLLASFVAEKQAGLGLLKQMFGEGLEKADEWAEVDSEVEELEGRAGGRKAVVVEEEEEEDKEEEMETEDEEVVPEPQLQQQEQEQEEVADETEGEAQSDDEDEVPTAASAIAEPVAADEQETASSADADEEEKPVQESLKDMFVPRQETGGFTLDLELDDLDDDPTLAPPILHAPTYAASMPTQRTRTTYEPTDAQKTDFSSYPLFFPTWDQGGNPVENHTTLGGRRKPKTFWDVVREKGWMDGWKRETEDEARQRWEEVRGQLTQEWKKRSREARRRKKATGLAWAGDGM
ncbi:hypothetical protein CALVIDRAFT_567015 [Calocera viscosa TUFC12733]|uniref:RRM domain-containing protein n=1 Tax=Calocera viscosa (strain TUFC12733) TaxID=1330018 RepID=A0A167ISK1_CALVF|nr:hypothetical protein CALVIDRAFT_567015 [Calocera viscosa TUFC12733]